MTSSFNQGGDHTAATEAKPQGSTFETPPVADQQPVVPEVPTVTAEELAAIAKRDEHAQTHIKTLELEAENMRKYVEALEAKAEQAASVEELLNKETPPASVDVDGITTSVTEAVKQSLQEEKLVLTQNQNFEEVSRTLTEKFGTDVDSKIQEICSENAITFDEMVDLARKNPKLALKICDVKVEKPSTPSQTSINSAAFMAQNASHQQAQTPVNVMELRTDKSRVDDFNRRMESKLRELGKI